MYLPKFFNYFLLLVIVFSVFTSCTKDDPIVIEESNESKEFTDASATVKAFMEMDNAESASAKTCFNFKYPIQLILEDESKQTIKSLKELTDAFKTWYAQNKGKENKEPTFNYPLEVSLEDGTVKKIANNKELTALIKSCKNNFDEEDKDGQKDNCFEINYPLTLVYNDKSTLVVNSLQEYKAALEDKQKGKPSFTFPIEITFDEHKIYEVKSQDELDKLYKDCKGSWYEEEKDKEDDSKYVDLTGGFSYCFQISYPINLVLWDETVKTLVNAEEATTWVNSKEFDKYNFQFPIEIILKDEKIRTINTKEEWNKLRSSCKEDKGEDIYDWHEADKFSLLFSDCFEVNYPISLFYDDKMLFLNNQEEIIEHMRTTGRQYFKFHFPIHLTINDKNIEITSMQHFMQFAIENCPNTWDDDKEEEEDHEEWNDWNERDWEKEVELLGVFSDCFQINYPLTLIYADGTNQVVNSVDDMAKVVRSPDRQAFIFQFPVSITTQNEERKEIATVEELNQVVKTCLENWQENRNDWEDIWDDTGWDEINWDEDFRHLGFMEDCFQFNYPISVSFENKDDLTVNNDDEFKRILYSTIQDFFNDNRLGSSEINFPLSVTLNNGSLQTLQNEDEIWKLMEDCE